MEINEKNIKRWSMLGARPTLGQVLLDLAERMDNLIVITADVSSSAGLERLKKKYPDKFIDVGIAEQNMMGIACGLAKEGFRVATTSFAPFQSMRCLEQIRVNQGYMGIPITMIGLSSSIYHSYLGNTHCCFEDGAILRAIPNISVVTPADCTEIVKAVEASVNSTNSVYIRLSIEGSGLPIIYNENFDFEIGKANVLEDGNDIAILSNGSMVNTAKLVANNLREKNISVRVVDFHTIKPIDTKLLDKLQNFKYVVTIEEHNVIGGLASSVAEYIMQQDKRPQLIMFGINDFYPHASDYETALRQCGLTVDEITDKIIKRW